jgi:hypothetical protein
MAIEPTAREFESINQFSDRVALLGFKCTIWKAAPHTPSAVNRWDVNIFYKDETLLSGFGNSLRLADAIGMACDNLYAWMEKTSDANWFKLAPLLRVTEQLMSECARLPRTANKEK